MLYGAMNFPIRPVLKEIEAIGALGFDYLELAMDNPRAHHTLIREQKRELVGALSANKMKLVCHLPTFVFTADLTESLRQASVNEVLQSIELAADLESLKAVLHPSYFTGLSVFVLDQAREYALESLDAIVERSDRLGLVLCIENMFPATRSLVEPADFVEIFQKFPTLKMTLDTGHAHIGDRGGIRAVDFIRRFPDRISHVHANDNFGKEDNHLPIGAGTVDFPKIAKALNAAGYDATVTLEVFSRDRDYLKISREKFAAILAAD
jgi:sugar phosphate isomerase/epimerase